MELAQARKTRITPRMGGRILADALVAQGIDHVFSVPANPSSIRSTASTTCGRS